MLLRPRATPRLGFSGSGWSLALTRYCYYQYCKVYGIRMGGREGFAYCPSVVEQYCNLAFTSCCFTSKLYCGSQSSLSPPLHLQSLPYCNTIARPLRNIRPPSDSPCICNTTYNIGNGNIVYRPNCNRRAMQAGRKNERTIDFCTNDWKYKNII